MTARPLARRLAVSILVAGATVSSVAGCTFFAPTATMYHYDPADGVGADLGEVKLRDVQAVPSEDGSAVNVVFYAVNGSGSPITVRYSAPTTGGKDEDAVSVRPGAGVETIAVEAPKGAANGGLYPVTFTASGADSVTLDVPVLDAEGRAHLEDYVP